MSENFKLLEKMSKMDDDAPPMSSSGATTDSSKKEKKYLSERNELLKKFDGLKTREEFLRKIVQIYEEEKDINILKNQVFGISVFMNNLEHAIPKEVKSDDSTEAKIEILEPELPQAEAEDTPDGKYIAISTYYKPFGFLRGHEKKVDSFVRRNLLKDAKSRNKFLLQNYYIFYSHFMQKKKEDEKKQQKKNIE